MNVALAKEGLCKVREKKGNAQASGHLEELVKAQEDAQKKKIGLWTNDFK